MNRAVMIASVRAAFVIGLSGWEAVAGAGGLAPQQAVDTVGQDYHQDAHPLISLPPQDLVKALPELSGLELATSQQQLPRILDEVGKALEASYQKFTEIVATEQISHEQRNPTGRVEATAHYDFNYLILPHYEAGLEGIEEYRTGVHGEPASGTAAGAAFSQNFASLWALFIPGNQSASRFRHLGELRSGTQSTLLIGFAQRPGWSTIEGKIKLKGQDVVLLYQGVGWVDSTTYRILKLRVDLLKPRLDLGLERQTTEIQFGEVHLSDAASSRLWVPLRVTVTSVWNGAIVEDRHVYSHYQLPASTSTIKTQ